MVSLTKYKVYMDDMRDTPQGWVRTYTVMETQKLLAEGVVEELSLDHDMGDMEPTGYELICWMEEHDIWPKKRPHVHSSNPAGRRKMELAIERKYGRNMELPS